MWRHLSLGTSPQIDECGQSSVVSGRAGRAGRCWFVVVVSFGSDTFIMPSVFARMVVELGSLIFVNAPERIRYFLM